MSTPKNEKRNSIQEGMMRSIIPFMSKCESVEVTHVSLSLHHVHYLGSCLLDAREWTSQIRFMCGSVSVSKENLNPIDILSKKRFNMGKKKFNQ